jgi:uncharacterized membrane protein YqjE
MANTGPEHGLLPSLRRVLATLADMAQSRLELASIEVGEAIERLIANLIVAFIAVLLLGAALISLSALIVYAVDESRRVTALAAMVLVYGIGGVLLLLRLRTAMRTAPPMLAGTLGELRNDTRVLRGQPPADRG